MATGQQSLLHFRKSNNGCQLLPPLMMKVASSSRSNRSVQRTTDGVGDYAYPLNWTLWIRKLWRLQFEWASNCLTTSGSISNTSGFCPAVAIGKRSSSNGWLGDVHAFLFFSSLLPEAWAKDRLFLILRGLKNSLSLVHTFKPKRPSFLSDGFHACVRFARFPIFNIKISI